MLQYILGRIVQSMVGLLILSMIIFGLSRASGDPLMLVLPDVFTEEQYESMRQHLGLDRPLYVQYGLFIANAIKGDLGESIYSRRPVRDLIAERLPNSLKLALAAALIGGIWAIPLAIVAAVRKGTLLDGFVRVVAALGQATPIFWLGLVLMQIFSVQLGLLPTSGMGSWSSYLMPGLCLAWFMMAGVIRLIRSSMLDTLDSEYIKLARIKGLSERAVVWKHALRNSLLPVVSFGGVYIALIISSSIVTETVFAWPGFGRLVYQSILARDYPLIQGVVLTAAVIVMVANLFSDILYAYLDPRIRYRAA